MSVNNSSHFSNDLSLDEIPGFEIREEPATPGTSSEISGLSVDELRRAYTARLSDMEREMREVKEQLQRTIVMSYGKKNPNTGQDNGKLVRVGGQRPQYDGTDAVNYQRVTAYAADILFPHIKFLERGWNEYDETKDSVCDKMMNKTGIYVPRCLEKSWYWENTIAGMVHIKYRNLKCNFHNAVRKAFLSKS